MLPFGPPAAFYLTAATPSPVNYDQGISPKHTLNVHDVDGEEREWRVDASVAKVSIYNAKNLTLRLPGRVVTSTVEVFNAENVKLVVGPSSSPLLSEEIPSLGVLQLDPPLKNVSVVFTHSQAAGSVVVAPHLAKGAAGQPSFGFSSLSVQAGEARPFALFDAEGRLCSPDGAAPISPSDPPDNLSRQLVLSQSEGKWKVDGLQRNEKDYPQLS
ncbi:hypothetical protein JCM10213_009254 [Rhodosporidiobolus nylandii]